MRAEANVLYNLACALRAEAGLLHNLAGGLRLLAFLPVDHRSFVPSLREVVWLGALAGSIWLGFDRLTSSSEVSFAWSSVAQLSWLAVVVVCALLLFSPAGRSSDNAALTLAAVASVLPGLLLVILLLLHFSTDTAIEPWVGFIVAALCATYLYRIVRRVVRAPIPASLAAGLVVVGVTWWIFNESVTARPLLWRAKDDAHPASIAGAPDIEETILRQPALIEGAVARLAPATPGKTDVFFVGFAGDGRQQVFANEVSTARAALARRFELNDRALELVNSPRINADTPLATAASLRLALARVGQRMNVDEDVLILFLTSHGTESGKLSVHQPAWPLRDLSPDELDEALRAAGIKWRIVIVSACYSGRFIQALNDAHSLVVTAARADRKSFGCRDDRELTYYGEALFRDALPQSRSLQEAVVRARVLVTMRERAEDMTPSEPQTFLGDRMGAKLAELYF